MAKTEDINQKPDSPDKLLTNIPVCGNSDDSNDSVASSKSQSNIVKYGCTHVIKSLDINSVKKNVARVGGPKSLKCCNCRRKNVAEPSDEQDLSLCLNCGSCNCKDHAVEHFKTPRSDPHTLVVSIRSWTVWCYKCEADVPVNSGRLNEGINVLKNYFNKALKNQVMENNGGNVLSDVPSTASAVKNSDVASTLLVASTSKVKSLPSPRGLINIGNTCFLNSVLQCLAQTPFLLEVLFELAECGEKTTINISETENLLVELEESGPVTRSLASTLSEMTSGSSGPYTPSAVLDALRKKCRQFIGYNQHDSHELLRQLLDNVKTEDIRRYQKHILNHFGLSTKVNPSEVDEKKRSLFKSISQKLTDKGNIKPDPVFRGTLVSTVQCTKCKHKSEVVENFLDLSLPVSFEKLQPPTLARRKNVFNENNNNNNEKPKSKHQKKKEQKAARRAKLAKIKKRLKDEEVKDVQRPQDEKKDVNESGYSSGKASSPVQNNKLLAEALNEVNSTSPTQSINSINDENRPAKLSVKAENNLDSGNSEEGKVVAASSYLEESENSAENEANADGFVNNVNSMPSLSPTGDANNFDDGVSPSATATAFGYETRFVLVDSPPAAVAATAAAPQCTWTSSSSGSSDNDKDEDNDNEDNEEDEAADGDDDSSDNEDADENAMEEEEEEDSVNVTLQLRDDYDDGSVMSCLSQFTACEILTGNNKVKCDACTDRQNKGVNSENDKKKPVYQTATKQLLVNSPPPVLILHLKRFQAMYTSLRKVSKIVTFPPILDIGPFCSAKCQNLPVPGQKKVLYSLYGVVVHSGSLHGGHYIAYVKVRKSAEKDSYRRLFLPRTDHSLSENVNLEEIEQKKQEYLSGTYNWYCISDSSVQMVSQEQVLNKEAYLLFYERIF